MCAGSIGIEVLFEYEYYSRMADFRVVGHFLKVRLDTGQVRSYYYACP